MPNPPNPQEGQMREWSAEKLEPTMAFFDGEDRCDSSILVQATGSNEIALHVTREDKHGDDPPASVYLSPVQATQLEERLRTARLIASEVIPDA